jgi:hypothetical protein
MSQRATSRLVAAAFMVVTCATSARVAARQDVLLVVLAHGDDNVSIAHR